MFYYVIFAHIVHSAFAMSATSQEDWEHRWVNYDKIFGGVQALENTHPHMASLAKDFRHRKVFCGGSIIGTRTILTAAHCIDDIWFDGDLDDSLLVTVGSNIRRGGNTYTVSHNVTHPKYMPEFIKNDIALLITFEGIQFDDTVFPIQLDYKLDDEHVPVKVAGWGNTEMGTYSHNLMELRMETISGEECLDKLTIKGDEKSLLVDPDTEICTNPFSGRGTCMIDSGSPLVRTDTYKQIGIVSRGVACAKGVPDVYVKISAYKDWIENNIV